MSKICLFDTYYISVIFHNTFEYGLCSIFYTVRNLEIVVYSGDLHYNWFFEVVTTSLFCKGIRRLLYNLWYP